MKSIAHMRGAFTVRTRAGAFALSAALAATAVAGCGSGDRSSESAGGMQQVTVGVLTSLDVAPIYLGEKQGFFEDENLDLTFEIAQGGAVLIPSVVSGNYDFGFSNIISLIVARSKGLPLRMVTAGSASANTIPDYSAILVNGNSAMESAKELEGKTVAVNVLNGNGYVTIRESIRKAGGDPDKTEFVELTYADMITALQSDRIDGAFAVEPFVTESQDAGNKVLAWNFMDVGPKTSVAAYFSTDKLISSDPELVEGFTAAMNKSLEYAQEHPDEVRAIVPTFTDISAELTAKVVLPGYPTELNRESVERQADLARGDGLLDKPVDLDDLLP